LQVGTSNGSRGSDLERGPALKQELAAYRKFKPHVVFTERPDNYVAYPAAHWDKGGTINPTPETLNSTPYTRNPEP